MVDKSIEDPKKGNVVNAGDLKVMVIKKGKTKLKFDGKILSEIKTEPN
jgi:hypothetical protein